MLKLQVTYKHSTADIARSGMLRTGSNGFVLHHTWHGNNYIVHGACMYP